MKKISLFIFLIFIVSCAPKVIEEKIPEPSKLDDFAKCLSDNELRMYGQYTCSICKKQRALFGASFHYVDEIECHPRGDNPQTERCAKMGIEKTPTWILEKDGKELERKDGFQSLKTLSEMSGCPLPSQ